MKDAGEDSHEVLMSKTEWQKQHLKEQVRLGNAFPKVQKRNKPDFDCRIATNKRRSGVTDWLSKSCLSKEWGHSVCWLHEKEVNHFHGPDLSLVVVDCDSQVMTTCELSCCTE